MSNMDGENYEEKDWQKRAAADQIIMEQAINGLMQQDKISGGGSKGTAVTAAVQRILQLLDVDTAVQEPGIFFGVNNENFDFNSLLAYTEQLCSTSGISVRKVRLGGNWHNSNSGHIIAFDMKGNTYVLSPDGDSGYKAWSAEKKEYCQADEAFRSSLFIQALMPYKTFPERKIGILDILQFVRVFYTAKNVLIFTVAVILSAALGATVPAMSGMVFGDIVPGSEAALLIVVASVLFLLSLGGAMVQIVEGFALSNIEVNADMAVHAAVISRLFSMPESFFKKYTAGELLTRLSDINNIRTNITNTAIKVLTSAFSLIFNGALMFYYAGGLAWFIVFSSALYAVILALISWRQMFFYRMHLQLSSEMSSRLLQIISGIAKIKVMRAEKRIFARWAEVLEKQLTVDRKEYNWGIVSGNILTLIQVVTMLVIYYYVANTVGQRDAVTLPAFIGFNAAYGVFSASFSSIAGSLSGLIHIAPTYERIKPLLKTMPETAGKGKAELLQGGIKVDSVSFKYADDNDKMILDNVNIEAKPGEFIAVVGGSGSGKTTLLRLLLGFEVPTRGAVFYDQHELSTLDIKSVRRQCGIVLQTGQLLPGSILQNITGVYNYGMAEAWWAAEAAGIAEDIKRMPMQMFTMIPEGATTISGGQKQRLLIARALIKKPRYVFFDEATSALDNISQSVVMRSLENLAATRVIIAHRLSTIRNADRIYVLDKGRVAEYGTYDELIAGKGLFAEFAEKQEC